jgi:gluconokinase
MNVLTFDISSGGLSAGIFDADLSATSLVEVPWEIPLGSDGAATLEIPKLLEALAETISRLRPLPQTDAVSFSGFMHSSIFLDENNKPVTPIFTWMDRRGTEAVDQIRREFGSSFHQRTGCRFHPMYPIFKQAWLHAQGGRSVVSAKSLAIASLTGNWVEDHGTASSSGLYNVRDSDWDPDLTRRVQLDPGTLPKLIHRDAIAGHVTPEATRRYGLPSGTPVIAGSGDGFLANLGSGCGIPTRIAVTLGTSSSVRQVLSSPVLDDAAGTFCYRAHENAFLFGCASSNGGNVLDWARILFGGLPEEPVQRSDLPTFLPLLNGERSPEWDAALTASWTGVTSLHGRDELARSVIDGVIFNLAHYVDILEHGSGVRASEVVLSGNGFLNPLAAETLASVLDARVLQPRAQGLASLRGAAVCGLQALGVDPLAALERLLSDSDTVVPAMVPTTRKRYLRYRDHRSGRLSDLR